MPESAGLFNEFFPCRCVGDYELFFIARGILPFGHIPSCGVLIVERAIPALGVLAGLVASPAVAALVVLAHNTIISLRLALRFERLSPTIRHPARLPWCTAL